MNTVEHKLEKVKFGFPAWMLDPKLVDEQVVFRVWCKAVEQDTEFVPVSWLDHFILDVLPLWLRRWIKPRMREIKHFTVYPGLRIPGTDKHGPEWLPPEWFEGDRNGK